MPFLKVEIQSPYVGTEDVTYHELPEDWEKMTPEAQRNFEEMCWDDAVANYVDGSTEIVENEDD